MGGYISSIANFNSPNSLATGSPISPASTSLSFSGGTVGASATYMNLGFFVDALGKADFLTLDVGNIPGAFCSTSQSTLCAQSVYSTTFGGIGNVGYRFELGRYFFEPVGTVEWDQNRIGNLNLAAAAVTVQFPNNDAINVGGGARVGGVLMDDSVHYLEISAQGRVWDHIYNNSVNFMNLGPTFTLTDNNFPSIFGEAAIQLDLLNRFSGWSAFMRFDAKFNEQFQTFTGTLGVRYAF